MLKPTPPHRELAGSAHRSRLVRVLFAASRQPAASFITFLTGVFLYTRGYTRGCTRGRGVWRGVYKSSAADTGARLAARRFSTSGRRLILGGALAIALVAAIGVGLARPAVTAAATSNTVNFQARLETSAGAIAPDGNYNVEFKLYYATGSALWTEDYLNSAGHGIRVTNGYLTANLGSLTAFPSTIDWSQQLYLGMNIGGTSAGSVTWDGEMTPRLQLTAVPYAFKAAQAAQAAQLATTNGTYTSTLSLLQPTGGNQTFQVQDQGAAGTYNLCVANSTTCGFAAATGGSGYIQNQNSSAQTSSNFWISGTGRAGTMLQAPAFDTASPGQLTIGGSNATSIVLGQSGVNTQVAGNLSVGTTSSYGAITLANGAWLTALDSTGTGAVNVLSVNSNNEIQVGAALNVDGGIILPTDGGQITLSDLPVDANAAAGTPESYTLRVGSTNALTVYGESDGAGNTQNVRVAIGSSITPAYTLDVGGDVNTSSLYRVGGTAGVTQAACTSGQIFVPTTTGGIVTGGSCVSNGGSGNGNYIQNGTSLQTGANFDIDGVGTAGTLNATTALQTAGVTRLDASGNLSNIGTYSGSGNITTTGGVLNVQGTGTNSLAGFLTINGASSSVTNNKLVVSGVSYASNQNGGISVVAGTTTQQWETYFNLASNSGGVPRTAIGFNTRNSSNVLTSSVEAISILSTGNVGIGTTLPSYKLQVAGSAQATTLYQGSNQVCDTSGNCVGTGGSGGAIGGSGTSGTIAVFTAAGTIGNSQLTQSGTTVSASGSLNAVSGVNTGAGTGTQRIDASGNLVNIGNETASGNGSFGGNLTATGNLSAAALGLGGITNPQGALEVTNNSWLTSVDAAGTGTVNILKVNANNEIQLGAALNVDGGIILPSDSGPVTLVDEPFTAGLPAGSANSYTLGIGQSNALTVYGENDGSGNAQNVRVAIGSAITPQYTLDVGGDVNTTGAYRVGGTVVVSSGGILQSGAFSGTYGSAVTLSNTGNVFYGNGANLTNLNGGSIATGTVAVARGGTGTGVVPTNGQILIGNGSGYSVASLTAGTGISITGGSGSITIASAAGSGNYIQNGTTVQSNSNFNISGNGTFGGTAYTSNVDSASAGGTLNLGATNATTVNVGGGTANETLNLGNSSGNDTVNIATGAGTDAVNIGTNTTGATTIVQGSSNTGTTVKLQGGSTYLDVTNTGVGIGTTTPVTALDVNGAISSRQNNQRQYSNVYQYYVGGTQTGTLEIVLPNTWSNSMLRFQISGYNYGSSQTWQVVASGYNNITNAAWLNTSAEIRGVAPFTTVRFAYDSSLGKDVLLLGTTSTGWSYPQFAIDEVSVGYGGQDSWGSGYSSAFLTSESNISGIVSPVTQQVAYTSQTFLQGGNSFGTTATLGTNDAQALNFETNNTTRLTIAANGNTTLNGPLAIYAGANNGVALHVANGSPYNAIFYNDTYSSSTAAGGVWTDNSGGVHIGTNVATPLYLYTGGPNGSRLTVSGGSVGIGTTSPGQLLDVQGGNINTSGNLMTGGTTRISNAGVLQNVTYNGSTISVPYGGTGATTLTQYGVLYGNGTGALQATAAGGAGQCLVSQTGGAPYWSACTGAPVGNAGGDLTGTYPNPTIAKLQGTTLTISSIASGQVLQYNGTAVVNNTISGAISLSSAGVATLGNGVITNTNLAAGSFTNITQVGTLGSLNVTGNATIGGNVFLSSSTSYNTGSSSAQKEQNVNGVTVPAAGWYRVAAINGAAGRGQNTVSVYTTGGNYTPRSTTIRWWDDWGATAGISVISEAHGGYWSQARVTTDGTNSYLEVYFTQAITSQLNLSMQYDGGFAAGTLLSGTLTAGSGTVLATSTLGLFDVGNNALSVDNSGNLGIGTASPGQLLDVQGGNINTSGSLLTGGTVRLDNSGNLQNIGTYSGSGNITTTGGVLSVQGTGTNSFSGNLAVINTSGTTTITGAGLTVNRTASYINNSYVGGVVHFVVSNVASDDTTALTLLSTGNVGIGTTTPTYKLQVAGSIQGTSIYQGSNQVCDTSGNCVGTGGSGGAIGGSGTNGTIAMFTPDGNHVGNSLLTQSGSTVTTTGNSTTTGNATAGNYLGTGTINLTGTGSSSLMGSLGLGVANPQGALEVTNNSWLTSTDAAGTGTINILKVNANNEIQVGAALNIDGGIILPTDGGQMTLGDLPISSSTAAGTAESYSLQVAESNVLTVYGQADGSGNLQNGRVAIGTSNSPNYTLDVAGDINTTGVFRINGTPICTSSCAPGGGSGNYIQNGTSVQTGANFNIDGTGTVGGNLSFSGTLYGNGKNAISTSDVYLRLNQSLQFTSGVYTPGAFRADGNLQVGSAAQITLSNTGNIGAIGNGTFGGTVYTNNVDTATASTLNLGATNATTINLGGGTVNETLNIGNSTGNDIVNIATGSGADTINLGSTGTAINILSSTSLTGNLTVSGGTSIGGALIVGANSAQGDFVQFSDTFDGTTINPSNWTVTGTNTTQNGSLTVLGAGAWTTSGVTSTQAYRRSNTLTLATDVITPSANTSTSMVGFASSTAMNYNNMPHAIYFSSGTIAIYENGVSKGNVGSYTASTTYRVRISVNATGARYYLSSDGGNTWKLLYDGTANNVTNSPLYVRLVSNGAVGLTIDNLTVSNGLDVLTDSQLFDGNLTVGQGNLLVNTGSVGIGTSSPSAKLDVQGTAIFKGSSTTANASAAPLTTSTAEFLESAESLVTIGESSVGSANPAITLYRTGSGLRSGTAVRLYVPNSSGQLQFQTGTSQVAYGSESYTTTMTILGSGLVGIGTTNPQYSLDVNGSAQFQNSLYANGKQFLVTNDNYLRINQTNQFSSGIWFGSSTLRAGYGGVYLGSSGGDGQIALLSTSGDTTRRITLNGGTGNVAATSFTQSGNAVCDTSGNCVGTGGSGGAIGGSGTNGVIAMFTPDGNHVGNSALSQSSGNITDSGNLTVNGSGGVTAQNVNLTGGGAAGAGTQQAASNLYIQSRGTNLVTNGTGLLGNNYNFSSFTFDPQNVYAGGGSFKNSTYGAVVFNDELIPVDPNSTYQLSLAAEATTYVSGAHAYFGVAPFDADGLAIGPINYSKYPGSTDTTLAAALSPGATTVTLTNAAGWWNGGGSAGTYAQMVWYGYTNGKGYTYPDYTYTRNGSVNYGSYSSNGTWAASGISGNVITLSAPWSGPALPAGTTVRNAFYGGTYKYIAASNVNVPSTWTTYSGRIGGIDVNGTQNSNLFPYGTAYVKLLFLMNRDVTGNTTNISDISFTNNSGVFTAQVANQVPVVIQGATSQTGDLLDLQNANGSILTKVDANGNLTTANIVGTGTLTIQGTGASSIAGNVTLGNGTSGEILTIAGKNTISNTLILDNASSGNPTLSLSSALNRYLNLTNTGTGTFGLTVQGNVGIGTTSPGQSLDVQGGNINTSGNLMTGGTTRITSAGILQTVTYNGSTVQVAYGGTGATTLTAGGVLFGNGTSGITASGVLANGQLLIGDGSGAPTAATLTAGSGISITNGAGSITIASAAGSGNYIQNQNASPQIGANFNIDGTGTAGNLVATSSLQVGANLGYSALSQTFQVDAGSLGTTAGNELLIASLGAKSSNQDSLTVSDYRATAGSDWTSSNLILGRNVDNTIRAGAYITFGNGSHYLGVNTLTPAYTLDVNGTVRAASTITAPNLYISAANGDGIGFWNTSPSTYGIQMSNVSSGFYGSVNDYYQAYNMSTGTGRGFVWEYAGSPAAALNASSGNFALKGTLTVNGTGTSTIAGPLQAPSVITNSVDTASAGTLSLGSTNATTINLGGGTVAETLNIGNSTGKDTVNIATNASSANVVTVGSTNTSSTVSAVAGATSLQVANAGVEITTALGIGVANPQGALEVTNNNWLTSVDAAGTGTINILKVNGSNQIQLGAALSVDGGIVLPADSGAVTLVDEPFSAGLPAGSANSYTFGIGQSNALTVYGQNDGNGNAQNVRVAIGSSIQPGYTLDVGGDINTSGTYRVNGVAISTLYAPVSGSGNYIQNGSSPQTANFNITGTGTIGTLAVTNTATFKNTVTLGTVGSTGGALTVASSHAGGSFTLNVDSRQANATTVSLPPDSNSQDTFCLLALANCGVTYGSGYYIQNGTAPQSASFNITGTGTIAGSFYTSNIDTPAASGTLSVGGINATTVNIATATVPETLNIATNIGNKTLNIATGSGTNTVTIGSSSTTTILQGGNAHETVSSTGVQVKTTNNILTAFQVQDSSATPVLDVDTQNDRVGIGTSTPLAMLDVDSAANNNYTASYSPAYYSCNSGDTLSGTTCTHTYQYQATYNNVYSCNSGDTLSGSVCTHTNYTYAANNGSYYSCPSGGSLSGTTCTYTYSASYQNGYYYCNGSDTLSGTTCYSYGSYAATGAYTCPQGGVVNGTTCVNIANPGPGNSCPAGYTYYEGGCFQQNGNAVYTYSCPSGGTLDGTNCDTVTTYSANYQSGYYYCPSGTLNGTTCTYTYSATYNTSYYCNGSDTLSGTTCYNTSQYAATDNGYYSCNGSDTLSGTTCTSVTTYSATYVAAFYYCPNGGQLNGTTCVVFNVAALIQGSASIGMSTAVPLSYTRPTVPGGSLSFTANTNYNASSYPWGVATADFNGDGAPDIVAANEGANTVSVLMNNGNGTFATQTQYAVSSSPMGVATGDFNGDGKPDIVVTNEAASTVSVLMNNGNGTFATAVNYNVGSYSRSVAVADVNGDGKPDIIVANSGSNTVSVLMNNGNGTFATAVNYNVGSSPYSVATADFNGDGKPDIVVTNYNSNTVSVLMNNGNGTFATAVNYNVGSSPYSVATADFNGDGKPDIVTANYGSGTVSVLMNNGNGTFATQTTTTTNYNDPCSLVVADFNGDGKPDIVYGSGNTYQAIGVLIGNGYGGFSSQSQFSVGSYYQYGVATADFNGDGKPDIVTGNSQSSIVSVLLNTTTFPVAAGTYNSTLSVQPLNASSAGVVIQGVTSQVADLLHVSLANGRPEQPNNTLMSTTGYNASTASYTAGYSFTPNVNGSVTQLGVRCVNSGTYTLQLWTSSGTLLATATATANNTTWVYSNITPVSLTAGTTYVVSEYSSTGYYCYQALTMPVTTNDITVNASALNSNNGDTFPSNMSYTSEMYGEADITFVSNTPGTSLAVTASGNVGIGTDNPNNALSVMGNIAATGTITGGVASPDYAENITASDPTIGAADVVTMDPAHPGQVIKASTPYDPRAMGVISTHPGFVTNALASTVTGDPGPGDAAQRPLALSGRVPVKVSTENGPIKLGDYLTTSDIPGVAMKATGSGAVIGVAMADFDGTESGDTACGDSGQYMCGSVLFFINPSANNPAGTNTVMQGGDAVLNAMTVNGALAADSINVGGMATLKSLTVTGDAAIGGNLTVGGDLTVAGTANVMNLIVGNHIISQGNIPIATVGPAGGQNGVVTIDGTDTAGTLTVNVQAFQPDADQIKQGMKPELLAAGALANITFAQSFTVTPRVVLSPDNPSSVGAPVYTVKTSNGYQLVITQAATNGTTYQFDYVVIGSNGVAASSP